MHKKEQFQILIEDPKIVKLLVFQTTMKNSKNKRLKVYLHKEVKSTNVVAFQNHEVIGTQKTHMSTKEIICLRFHMNFNK